jgi:hypothetical protein
MIPLRILHVLDPAVAASVRAGPSSLLPWLTAQGHAVAVVALGTVASDPFTCLGRYTGWWSWWRRDRRAAISAAGAWGADLVHAHGEGAISPAIDLARGLAAQLVVEPDTLAAPTTMRALRDGGIAAVLLASEQHRSTLLADPRMPRDRAVVVPAGVDVQLPPSRTVDGALVVGARLRRRDDVRALVEAVSSLRAAGLAVSTVVSLAPGLVEPVDKPGWKSVPPGVELAEADVLVELAANDLPMSHVVDALAAGRPVVAVAAGMLPELIQDGHSGVLVPEGDAVALAGALRQLAAADQRSACAAAAFAAARRHDIGLVGEAILGVYRATIGGSSAGGATTWKRLTSERLRRRTSNRQRTVKP